MKKLIFGLISLFAFVACGETKETIKEEQTPEVETRGIPICGTKKSITDTVKVEPEGIPICGTKKKVEPKTDGIPICGTK